MKSILIDLDWLRPSVIRDIASDFRDVAEGVSADTLQADVITQRYNRMNEALVANDGTELPELIFREDL